MKKISAFCIFLLVFGSAVYAQFKLSGEYRPRAEFRHGFGQPADSAMNPAFFVDQRTRLNIDHAHKSYKFKLVLQDIRVWGSAPQLNRIDGFSSIQQAWAEINFSEKFSLKAGRQEISLDDHRIMGNVDWAQQARSHDAALLKYEKPGLKLHLGGAYNQATPQNFTTNYPLQNYKTLQYLWFHKDVKEDMLGISLLVLSNGLQVNNFDSLGNPSWHDNYSLTSGGRITFKQSGFNAALNGYYQSGSTGTFPAQSISAYLVGLNLGYDLNEKLKAGLGFEIISGNDFTNTDADYWKKQRAFNPFYGTNHKFNGLMDYFYVGNHAGSVGLQDIFATVKYGTKNKFVGLDLHGFLSHGSIFDTKTFAESGTIQGLEKFMGVEADLTYGFPLKEGVMLHGGYSQMFVMNSLATLRGVVDYEGNGRTDQFNNWAWVMVTIKPTFIEK